MKIILISPLSKLPNEAEIVISLFECGLDEYQLNTTTGQHENELDTLKEQLPVEFKNRVSYHHCFPKFHSLLELNNYRPEKRDKYVFVSPVFNSISKNGYNSSFDLAELKISLKQFHDKKNNDAPQVIALGGMDEDKIGIARKIGFDGIALLGAVWHSHDPIEKFLKIKTLTEESILIASTLKLNP